MEQVHGDQIGSASFRKGQDIPINRISTWMSTTFRKLAEPI